MCGIAGLVSSNGIALNELERAGESIAHRGPDDKGHYISPDNDVGLVHRRLSLLDLTSAGHQPMFNSDKSLIIVFNGEIYNYIELKNELKSKGFEFSTSSDTEVILVGFMHWGTDVFCKLKGMFSMAIYDIHSKRLILARDRFGIKPLYYARQGSSFYFGSEMKAILSFKDFRKKIRAASISTFLANRYVSDGYTMWEDVKRLKPGCYMEISLGTLSIRENSYWHLQPVVNPLIKDGEEQEFFSDLFTNSIAQHLRSDVQVGAFLSGGMDSSALVATMQSNLNYPAHCFSIGFSGWKNSEHRYAQSVADHCGAKLDTLIVDRIDMDLLPKLMHHYDDPIADISILPTYYVSGLASDNVKAVVSGEGADEILGGYWWQHPRNYSNKRRILNLLRRTGKMNKEQIKKHYIGAMSMGLFDQAELKRALGHAFQAAIPDDPFAHFDQYLDNDLPVLKQIQYLDIHTFMSELILPKVDRASMAHSLEVRVPFLDHELIENIFSLPVERCFQPGIQKYLLNNYLKNLVPHSILKRPKQGFVGPDKYYMDYRMYKQHLNDGVLIRDGVIRKDYLAHLLRKKDHWRLWKLLVLNVWWNNWM